MVQMNVTAGLDSPAPPPAVGPLVASADWPVRSGPVPPLADRFSTRPETGPGPRDGARAQPDDRARAAIAPRRRRLVTRLAAVQRARLSWPRSSPSRSGVPRSIDLLVWIDASSTASILSGYVEAARIITGTRLPGIAESVAASFLGWLGQTDRRWLVVLDDLPDIEVLQGLWPGGPSGQVVITTAEHPGDGGPARRARRGDRPVQPPRGDELPRRQAVVGPRPAPRRD